MGHTPKKSGSPRPAAAARRNLPGYSDDLEGSANKEESMHKFFKSQGLLIASLLMVFSLVLSACGGAAATNTPAAAPATAAATGAYVDPAATFIDGFSLLSRIQGAGRLDFAYASRESSAAIIASYIATPRSASAREAGATRGL